MSWTVLGSVGAVSAQERETRSLYEEHARPLHGYVLQLLGGDLQRAEDVVQETLLRCWRNQQLTGGRGQNLRPWLFKVARNLVIDDYRLRNARPKEVDGTAWLDDVLADTDDVDQVLSGLVLAKAFQSLSPAHREVLYETYYTGRSTREVSVVLGIPPGTVKSRLYHAVRNLRQALGVPEAGVR
ncbi:MULTISPECIES: sigma-70 family RNA polymerase sigma factor [unclassified Streptomyces]|uniref:sigma-70 family RNA polymerase sigma factor n=1 Tax=unclassified Streptomyces TaxID=2593676 RepID=UPI002DDA3532|nr:MULTISPECIES: sigma-70 family RNA polymerase sigma factor [unclassified Streptomyces]WSA91374.1 sigma-70 family RNA polymerase sigma factor [Streptomyces sp. NBC_01795]WSB75698.1 sigma-70 family RNA polymerase sigma factor [Streptomyces sp. NBC_01775]WSS16017.1 sigma-70 family RNA polymerase sigma factor [Streptomyces sp. NBC_01186]WSS44836.1 sigma-70 family RNA polymerase sigma factor [Streptomyces sp. NBC_01187]